MKDIRYCEQCAYCKERKLQGGSYWLECTYFKIDVAEDDYCSFGKDIEPDDDPWDDRKVIHHEID